jgi:hypothetical protein
MAGGGYVWSVPDGGGRPDSDVLTWTTSPQSLVEQRCSATIAR